MKISKIHHVTKTGVIKNNPKSKSKLWLLDDETVHGEKGLLQIGVETDLSMAEEVRNSDTVIGTINDVIAWIIVNDQAYDFKRIEFAKLDVDEKKLVEKEINKVRNFGIKAKPSIKVVTTY